jgi:tryptophan synthase alpha chain
VVIGSRIIEEIERGPAEEAPARVSAWLATIRAAVDQVAKRAA